LLAGRRRRASGYVIDLAQQTVSCTQTIEGMDVASLERLKDGQMRDFEQ
jgi:hypothetical protein